MQLSDKPNWILLEYGTQEQLNQAIRDREMRWLLYPAVGRMRLGDWVDVHITVENSNVIFPMKAVVMEVRERPAGPEKPRGVLLQVIAADRARFDRLCAFVDRVWQPSARRSAPRYQANVRASYLVAPTEVEAETLDISERGMFLRSSGPLLEPGMKLVVKLQPSKLRGVIALESQVRWVDTVISRQGMGLLCSGPPDSLKRLATLVAQIVASTKV